MGGFFHAASSLLDKIDAAQNHFLHELDLSPSSAFLNFNFAPPSLRRNIGILGLLHKRVLGKCHPTFERLFSVGGKSERWSSKAAVCTLV